MRVITESELREKYKKQEFTTFSLPEGVKLTPAASQFLNERRIKIIHTPLTDQEVIDLASLPQGKKPEHYTHLRGEKLIIKNHPRIRLRGKLDSFQAILINIIIQVCEEGYADLAQDLRGILNYARQIMTCEVKGEPLPPLKFRDYSEQEIHELSHNPQNHFGFGHFLPDPKQGKVMASLNYLRTQIREVELCAIDAFYSEGRVEREDIIRSLNRLSSLFYVLMLKLCAGEYKKETK